MTLGKKVFLRKYRHGLETAAVISIVLLAMPAHVRAMSRTPQTQTSHPVVSEVKGEVAVKGSGKADWKKVESGTLLFSGDLVRSGPDGRARIMFAGGMLELYEESEVRLPSIGRDLRRKDIREVVVRSGSSFIELKNTRTQAGFHFRTSNASGSAANSKFTVSCRGPGTAVSVYDGEINLSYSEGGIDKKTSLVNGTSFLVLRGQAFGRILSFDPANTMEKNMGKLVPVLEPSYGLPARETASRQGRDSDRTLAKAGYKVHDSHPDQTPGGKKECKDDPSRGEHQAGKLTGERSLTIPATVEKPAADPFDREYPEAKSAEKVRADPEVK